MEKLKHHTNVKVNPEEYPCVKRSDFGGSLGHNWSVSHLNGELPRNQARLGRIA